jgi:RimJ/RimL family protein N-acetyltransferase
MTTVQVRPATEGDSRSIFGWRNDPVTISTSRTKAGVEWEGHQRWFPAQLAKDDTVCLIGVAGEPCGVVWFRKGRSGVWETSVNMSPAFRGRKLSAPMLAGAMEWMRKERGAEQFSTEIQDTNTASIKMFERCGFVYVHPSPGFGTYFSR